MLEYSSYQFLLLSLCLFIQEIIDGIDGLSGGVFASIFAAYAVIAFFQNQINLAAFCTVIIGSILAFLWFNISPARFYMSETGSMALHNDCRCGVYDRFARFRQGNNGIAGHRTPAHHNHFICHHPGCFKKIQKRQKNF